MINWITISHFWIWWMKNKNNSRKMNHILYIIQMMDKIIAQYDTRWMRIEIQEKKESTRLLCCWWVRRKRCINDHTHVLKTIKKENIPRRSLKVTITKTEVAHPKHLSKCWKKHLDFFSLNLPMFPFIEWVYFFTFFNWSKDNNLFIAHTQWRLTAHQS